jgi:hypothetical protein
MATAAHIMLPAALAKNGNGGVWRRHLGMAVHGAWRNGGMAAA